MILVMAANGNQGSLLTPKLVKAGQRVRACVRTDRSADELKAIGVAEVMVGDMSDPDFMRRAFEGIDKVFWISPSLHPQQKTMSPRAVEVAESAGVKHFVLSSVLHSIIWAYPQHEWMNLTERALVGSTLEYTILQPANFMQPSMIYSALHTGEYVFPWDPDRLQTLCNLDDATDVALKVLLEGQPHYAATYELCTPGRFSAWDIRDAIARVTGKSISLTRCTGKDVCDFMYGDQKKYAYEYATLIAIANRHDTHDFIGNSNVMRWLLDRPLRTLDDFVRLTWQLYKETGSVPLSTSR